MTEFSAKFLPFVPYPRNFARNLGEIFALAREIYAKFLDKGLFRAKYRWYLNSDHPCTCKNGAIFVTFDFDASSAQPAFVCLDHFNT